jgi:ATP-binding cassette subfamily F protein 3
MITANQLALRRGTLKLFENAAFTLNPGWRVGLVGRNGCGKSSLFSMILGKVSADAGELRVQKGLDIGTVAQETPGVAQPAIDYVLDGDTELRDLEAALEAAIDSGDADKIGDIHDRLATIGGYAARSRAAKLLDGLGFDAETHENHVADFSGGWRMRLNLARALMRRSDLLLLDEPTNHLDLDAVFWLQAWLRSYEGTLLVISHDRSFLDAVTDHTLHIADGQVTLYTGNFSSFERQRTEKLSQQSALHSAQQAQIAHLQSFVDRFRASATKARQAQARVKMIERIAQVAAVRAESPFNFSFPEPPKLPSPLVRLNQARAAYGDTTILSGLRLGLEPGDRIGLLGRNGAGKSTLVKLLAGTLAPAEGDMLRAPDLRIGYFDQHQVDTLDHQATPMVLMQRIDPKIGEQASRNWLGRFNFQGNRVYEVVAPFSGGEKARLALALLVYQQPNLLLLDEPTNHLDLDMREALEMALQSYKGAMVLVSHDRHLVSATCDTLWLVAERKCQVFDGDLDDYARWLLAPRGAGAERTPVAPRAPVPAKPVAVMMDPKLLRETVKRLDRDMARLRETLEKLERELADPALYDQANSGRMVKLTQQQSQAREQLEAMEEEWLAAAEQLEAQAALK